MDTNNDGAQDATETGLAGIKVNLYRDVNNNGAYDPGVDAFVRTATTDATGAYLFSGLGDGPYVVQVDTSSTVTSPYDGTFTLAAATHATYDENSGTSSPDGVTAVTLSGGAAHLTADFGYNWTGTIGDYVWWDVNHNGMQDDGATPIANAVVLLYFDANGNGILDLANGDYQVAYTTTDASGIYHFDNLPPGRYLVDVYEDSFNPNPGVRETVPTTPNIRVVNLGAGQSVLTADFGYYVGAKVEGNVFWDKDRNGLFDGGDSGLSPVTVTLTGTDKDGNTISLSTTTDSSGHFAFVVPEGDYTLSYSTSQTSSMGYPDATTPTSYSFHAYPGEDWHPVFDFGVDNSGKVGDRVWNDANHDGVQDATEVGIAGVTVNLYASDGTTWLASTATDAYGAYIFEGLPNGTYVVRVDPATLPAGFTQTYDNLSPTNDHKGQGVVTGGGSDLSVDFGYYNATSYPISGNVFNDLGTVGAKDAADTGLSGVTVYLYDASGTTIIAVTTTDASGNYTFPGAPNGSYVVKVDAKTLPSLAYAETYESDGTVNNSIVVTVNNAPSTNNDLGFHAYLGSISGKVCVGNADGQCVVGEEALKSVTITLTYAGIDGIIGTADDVVTTTTTSGSGTYSFANLPPGLYQVKETNPDGYISLADRDFGNPDSISLILDWGPDGIPGNADDRMVKTGQDFEDALGGVAGMISPDPLEVVVQPGDALYLVQIWTNLGTTIDRGNITIYGIPTGWGVTVYRDSSVTAQPTQGA